MRFWKIKAAEENTENISLNIYGEIADSKFWGDEVTAKELKEDLDKYPKAKEISVYINSGGGSAFAGVAIYNILKRHKAKVTTYIDGLAASAASIIAMAGNNVIMPKNAMIMIHQAAIFTYGNAEELLKAVDVLEGVDTNITQIYMEKTGLDEKKIRDMLAAETWMDYKEAKNLGFCDEIEEGKQVAASIHNGILSINGVEIKAENFKNFPEFRAKKVIDILDKPQKEPKQNQSPPITVTGDDIKKYLKEIEQK